MSISWPLKFTLRLLIALSGLLMVHPRGAWASLSICTEDSESVEFCGDEAASIEKLANQKIARCAKHSNPNLCLANDSRGVPNLGRDFSKNFEDAIRQIQPKIRNEIAKVCAVGADGAAPSLVFCYKEQLFKLKKMVGDDEFLRNKLTLAHSKMREAGRQIAQISIMRMKLCRHDDDKPCNEKWFQASSYLSSGAIAYDSREVKSARGASGAGGANGQVRNQLPSSGGKTTIESNENSQDIACAKEVIRSQPDAATISDDESCSAARGVSGVGDGLSKAKLDLLLRPAELEVIHRYYSELKRVAINRTLNAYFEQNHTGPKSLPVGCEPYKQEFERYPNEPKDWPVAQPDSEQVLAAAQLLDREFTAIRSLKSARQLPERFADSAHQLIVGGDGEAEARIREEENALTSHQQVIAQVLNRYPYLGVGHDPKVELWSSDSKALPAVKKLAELGQKSPVKRKTEIEGVVKKAREDNNHKMVDFLERLCNASGGLAGGEASSIGLESLVRLETLNAEVVDHNPELELFSTCVRKKLIAVDHFIEGIKNTGLLVSCGAAAAVTGGWGGLACGLVTSSANGVYEVAQASAKADLIGRCRALGDGLCDLQSVVNTQDEYSSAVDSAVFQVTTELMTAGVLKGVAVTAKLRMAAKAESTLRSLEQRVLKSALNPAEFDAARSELKILQAQVREAKTLDDLDRTLELGQSGDSRSVVAAAAEAEREAPKSRSLIQAFSEKYLRVIEPVGENNVIVSAKFMGNPIDLELPHNVGVGKYERFISADVPIKDMKVGQELENAHGIRLKVLKFDDNEIVVQTLDKNRKPVAGDIVSMKRSEMGRYDIKKTVPVHWYDIGVRGTDGKIHVINVKIPALDDGSVDYKTLERLRRSLEKLPRDWANSIDEITMNPGRSTLDGEFEKSLGKKDFMSDASASYGGKGRRKVDFYHSQEKLPARVRDNLFHELGHMIAGDVHSRADPGFEWRAAALLDGAHVSEYAKTNGAEDFAETVLEYLATDAGAKNSRVRAVFANRFKFLDRYFGVRPEAKIKMIGIVQGYVRELQTWEVLAAVGVGGVVYHSGIALSDAIVQGSK